MASENGSTPEQGVTIAGEFVSGEPGRAVEPKNGGPARRPFLVRVLARNVLYTVEFWDEQAAGVLAAASKGDVVSVPVTARLYNGRLYWRGVGVRSAS